MKTLFISASFILFSLVSLTSCKQTAVKRELEGYNMKGEFASCSPMEEGKICTEVFTEEDRFADKCRQEGHTAYQCDCHEWLCSEKIEF